jgi:hypothetical protein
LCHFFVYFADPAGRYNQILTVTSQTTWTTVRW